MTTPSIRLQIIMLCTEREGHDGSGSVFLAADKDGNARLRKDFMGFTAEECGGEAASAVRRHDDQIASLLLGCVEDGPPGYVILDMQGLARHTDCACLLLDSCELLADGADHL